MLVQGVQVKLEQTDVFNDNLNFSSLTVLENYLHSDCQLQQFLSCTRCTYLFYLHFNETMVTLLVFATNKTFVQKLQASNFEKTIYNTFSILC